jgi:hypothetical protein
MKQQLWILNSTFLLLFFIFFILNMLLQQAPPVARVKKPIVKEREIQTALSVEGIENIYKNDLLERSKKRRLLLYKVSLLLFRR